jgi:opacity protein-like surface antigen
MRVHEERVMPIAFAVVCPVVAAVVLAAALAPAGASAAGVAGGTFRWNKTPFAMVDAYAFRKPDSFDATKKVTVLILTTTALDRKAIDSALDRESAIDGQVREGKGTSIQLSLGADGDLHGLNAQIRTEEGFQSFSTSGTGKVELLTNSAERIAGRVSSEGKKSFSDDSYEYELTFDVAVTPEPAPGKPLRAGGGEAGKAYVAYIAALQKGNVDAIARFWPKEKGAAMLEAKEEPDFKEKLDMLRMFSPKSVKVKGGSIKDDVADLDVVGKDADGNVMDGKVRMLRDGKSWRVEKEDLTTHTK